MMLKKLKKVLLATAVLAATSSVAYAAWGDGPYLGASTGVKTVTGASVSFYRAIPGDLYAGYGWTFQNCYYLAAEIFGEVGSASVTNHVAPGSVSVKTSWNYGISLLPGLMLSERTMAFVRAGYIRQRFNTAATTLNGWEAGVGGETVLCQNWSLRGEYDYSLYNRSSLIGRPQVDQFNFGVVYRFG